MELGLLGPLEVRVEGELVPVPGRRQRALLARLALEPNRTVAVGRLVDDLWGEAPPRTAAKIVQIAVSQLRKVLPAGVIATKTPGYVLVADEDEIDLHRFERLRREGLGLLTSGDAGRAAATLREALGLWRGTALGEFGEPFARGEAARLEELRLACVEARIDADLACGRHDELVPELETLVVRHPLRERFRRQQMLALYRGGRHGEALAAYAAYRRELHDALGIEPSVELRELERRMLNRDPTLDEAGAPREHPYVRVSATARQDRVGSLKTSPPATPSWYVERPRVESLLGEATSRRLVLVIAGAGFGKTTALAARARVDGWAWYLVDGDDASAEVLTRGIVAALGRVLDLADLADLAPAAAATRDAAGADAVAAALATTLEEVEPDRPLVLVLDDLHELGRDTPGAALVDGLIRYAPPWLHVVVGSREEPPFPVSRLRGSGGVLDIESADLAFEKPDVERMLLDRVGADAPPMADDLLATTGGWPVALYLASEALRAVSPDARPALVRSLTAHSETLVGYLADEVVARLGAAAHEVLVHVAVLRGASRALLDAMDIEHVRSGLAELVRHGLVTRPADPEGEHTAHALVRAFVLERIVTRERASEIRTRAARWKLINGEGAAALLLALEGPEVELVGEILTTPQQFLTEKGHIDVVLRAVEALSAAERRRVTNQTVAHAYLVRGELDRAQEAVDAWAPSATTAELADVLTLQRALLAIARGRPQDALTALLARGPEPPLFASAFASYQLVALGRLAEAEQLAERAASLVREPDQAEWDVHEAYAALSEVRLARGQTVEAEELIRAAIDHARRWDNGLAVCAHLCRLSTVRLLRGDANDALAIAAESLGLADRIGFAQFQGVARTAQSRALAALGRLDGAIEAARAAVALFGRAPSFDVVWSLAQLGALHLERGEVAEARSTLERAIAVAQTARAPAAEAVAASSLARLLAYDDPEAAARVLPSVDAVRDQHVLAQLEVLATHGWTAVVQGDHDAAATAASAAVEVATMAGIPAALADALALRSVVLHDQAERGAMLAEARSIWERIDAPLPAAKAVLALAALGAPIAGEELEAARTTLEEQAVRLPAVAAGLGATLRARARAPVAIRTFGRFAVQLDGAEVPPSAWQSRKARDLLKLLICRREAIALRDSLVEALWPDEDPRLTRNRLSVALNVARGVLDPEGRFPADRYIVADRDGLRLAFEHVDVDVVTFLRLARKALDAAAVDAAEARSRLEAAERAYGGTFLEEDVDAPWAAAMRDEVRSDYADVLRRLSGLESTSDRYHLRLLALDPADEDVHLDLVRMLVSAGRHGEARRAHRRYALEMRKLGIEPAPYGETGTP